MVKRVYTDYIQDILDSIEDIQTFIQEMSFDDFKDDRKTINAVVRSIEIIGECKIQLKFAQIDLANGLCLSFFREDSIL